MRRMATSLVLAMFALSHPARADGTIDLVNLGELSGGGATVAANVKSGDNIAVDEINAAGGILGVKIVMRSFDTQSNGGVAKGPAQKALDDDLYAPLGPGYSGSVKAVAPLVADAQIAEIMDGEAAEWTRGGLVRSPWGRAFVALRENPARAMSLGVDTRRRTLMAFATGSSLGALSGVLDGPLVGLVDPPAFSLTLSLQVPLMVIVGGSDHFMGPFVGALVAILLPEWLRFADAYYLILHSPLVMGLAIYSPTGLIGVAERIMAAWHRSTASRGVPLMMLETLKDPLRAFNVERGAIPTVIGPNGAGKSTVPRRTEAALDRFPALRRKQRRQASTLSGGGEKQLEIARPVARPQTHPDRRAVDRPVAADGARDVRLAERAARPRCLDPDDRAKRPLALMMSDYGLVLELGRTRMHDTATAIPDDPRVAQWFLGGASA